jgi:hypothetical protein
VEIESEKSDTTQVWAEKNGTITENQAEAPVRFQRSGRWVDIDLNLARQSDGTLRPKAHPSDLVLSGSAAAGTHDVAGLTTAGKHIGLAWTGSLPVPRIAGNKATYADVVPGIDLVVEVRRSGFEQSFVVHNAQALGRVPAVMQALQLNGVGAVSDGDGVSYVDDSGRVLARVAPPQMWDATVDPARPGEHVNAHPLGLSGVPAQRSAAATGIGFTADPAWLADPARKFPITIDPTVDPWASFDTYVSSAISYDLSTSTILAIGTTNSGNTKRLAYLNFNAGAYAYKHINYASVGLWADVASICSAGTMKIFGTIQNAYSGTR